MSKKWPDLLAAIPEERRAEYIENQVVKELALQEMLAKILVDPRYKEGLTYGQPRPGHEEGTVAKHIEELERTLDKLDDLVTSEEYWKLKVLIHVHDALKLEGKRRTGHQVSLNHPDSHASLACAFLKEFTEDEDLLNIVLYHDEGHALLQKYEKTGRMDSRRLIQRVLTIKDIDLYLIFTIIDGYTESKLKDRSPRWFVDQVNSWRPSTRAYEVLEKLGV